MQTCVDLYNGCILTATVSSCHCRKTLARYVTVCNTLADYCLTAPTHSLSSATQRTADRSTLKYNKDTE